jgi:hypothetical protein
MLEIDPNFSAILSLIFLYFILFIKNYNKNLKNNYFLKKFAATYATKNVASLTYIF